MKYILGIDAGTTNVKAVLFDGNGQEISVASRVSETNNVGNQVEQDQCVFEKVERLGISRIKFNRTGGKNLGASVAHTSHLRPCFMAVHFPISPFVPSSMEKPLMERDLEKTNQKPYYSISLLQIV